MTIMIEITDRTVMDPAGLLADDCIVPTDCTLALLKSRSSITIYTQYDIH